MTLVYVFRDGLGRVWSAALGSDVLKAFGSEAVLSTYFGGHGTFGWPPSAREIIGVWGHRNASRFRRILRERLGVIEIVHRPPPVRMTGASTIWHRPTRDERHALEQQMGQGRDE